MEKDKETEQNSREEAGQLLLQLTAAILLQGQ